MDLKAPLIDPSIPYSGTYDPDYLVCGISTITGQWIGWSYEDEEWYDIPSPIASFKMTIVTPGYTIENSVMKGKLINIVFINQVPIISGFSKPILSSVLTFDNFLVAGTVITALFQ